MIDLSRNAKIGRQVTRADQQDIDPVDRGYCVAILDALLSSIDDRSFRVEFRVQLGERTADSESGPNPCRSLSEGWKSTLTIASAFARYRRNDDAPCTAAEPGQPTKRHGSARTSGVMPMPMEAAQIVEVVSIE